MIADPEESRMLKCMWSICLAIQLRRKLRDIQYDDSDNGTASIKKKTIFIRKCHALSSMAIRLYSIHAVQLYIKQTLLLSFFLQVSFAIG